MIELIEEFEITADTTVPELLEFGYQPGTEELGSVLKQIVEAKQEREE